MYCANLKLDCTNRIAFDKWSKELVQRVKILDVVLCLVRIVRDTCVLQL